MPCQVVSTVLRLTFIQAFLRVPLASAVNKNTAYDVVIEETLSFGYMLGQALSLSDLHI